MSKKVDITAILAAHGIHDPWQPLEATGVANSIYATQHVVLRIATDHPDAIVDAYTESVAAPVARQAGVMTPRLIAFDASGTLVDRPYSIWDRVHGVTFGLTPLPDAARRAVWREVGQQLALLHDRVRECPDPSGYLDVADRELDVEELLQEYADTCGSAQVPEIEGLFEELRPYVDDTSVPPCFVHNDLHDRNIMCGPTGGLLALIDWGDAGWGDPALDFAAIPLDAVPAVLEGYGDRKRLGDNLNARLVWDHLVVSLENAIDNSAPGIPIAEFRRFLLRR
ncbi:hypothetical protein F183_A06380 [Bryobacterales bacterium F-183]|nr:hypothetical protein F183_A06380 [Bryobacterales bacterium F-183]